MRRILASIAFASASLAAPLAPAFSQTPGMQVVDTSGGLVATVVRVEGDNLIIKTDRHEASIPKSSFTAADGKLLFAMTRAELNAATDRSLAEAAAAIAPGATVKDPAGQLVGTIESLETEFATLKLQSGALVRVPRSGIAAANGEVVIGATAGDLEAHAAAEGKAVSQ
ncbi:MAG TPA: hypothetical protein VNH53_05690 [Sphingomicrobium sp.]|jgi:preprotein translocase subunit YajC|nr:hypothetical protein [Sphingomicrobium sp.]